MFVVSREIVFKAELPADTTHREATMADLRLKLDEWANDWDLSIMARPKVLPVVL